MGAPFISGITRAATVVLKQGGVEKYRGEGLAFVSDSNGVFTGRMENITPGVYDIYVKGWAHLNKKFASINLASGENNVDLTSFSLKAGDFVTTGTTTSPDNILNINDVSAILSIYTSLSITANDTNRRYDVNADNKIDIMDISLVLANYTQLNTNGD